MKFWYNKDRVKVPVVFMAVVLVVFFVLFCFFYVDYDNFKRLAYLDSFGIPIILQNGLQIYLYLDH